MKEKKFERVFVLGAGVSKHCGYPLTNSLLNEIFTRLKPNGRGKSLILNFIRNFYPNFNLNPINYPNIEEILSLLAISIELESRNIPQLKYRYYVKNANEINRVFLQNICQLFYEKLESLNENMAIFQFANCLKPKDIVISFNWDLNLEKALENINKEYMYYLDNKKDNKITILKPHGSINWYKQDEVNLKIDLIELLPLIEDYDKVLIFKPLRRTNTFKKDIVPFITPPILQKTILPELEIIWENIYQVLSSTNEINVLGYSLPNADLITRYTFGMAIRDNDIFRNYQREKRKFLVANPNYSVFETYQGLVGDPIQFEHNKFEDLKFKELFS